MDLASMKNGINSPTVEGGLRNKGNKGQGVNSEKIAKRPSFSKTNQQEMITEILKEYTWEEKFEWMHQKLLKADRLLNKKRPELSTQLCVEALLGLDFNCSDENQKRLINEIQVPCLLTLACCMRLKKDYAEGISYCNKAIELNRKNANCFTTRGLLFQASKDFNNALNDFKSAQKLAEKDGTVDLTEYQENIKAVSRKVRARKDSTDELKPSHEVGMEGYDEDDHHEELTIAGSRTSLDEDEGSGGAPKILRYNDDLEELNRFGVFRYAVYPFKVSMKYFKGKAEFCRRRKPNYEAISTDP